MATGRGKSPRKKKKARARKSGTPRVPSPSTVVATLEFESPTGRKYRVLRTTQTDPYDANAESNDSKRGH